MASRTSTQHRPARGSARTAMLDAALSLVRRQGWSATSVDQICAAAGVTKGAFFHHFASKTELGVAAGAHWHTVTAPLFESAAYNALPDPLDRIFGYLDFRVLIADGPLEAITCFAGTTVQEVFATSDPIRAACNATIGSHVARLAADLEQAIALYPPRVDTTAQSLATYIQTALQGGFVMAKAAGNNRPLIEAIAHLKTYFSLIFARTASLPKEFA